MSESLRERFSIQVEEICEIDLFADLLFGFMGHNYIGWFVTGWFAIDWLIDWLIFLKEKIILFGSTNLI